MKSNKSNGELKEKVDGLLDRILRRDYERTPEEYCKLLKEYDKSYQEYCEAMGIDSSGK
jgi:hypothetical protein